MDEKDIPEDLLERAQKIPTQFCPWCGISVNTGATVRGAENRAAVPGDYVVCLVCGNFGRFDDEMKTVRYTGDPSDIPGVDEALKLSRLRSN